MYFYRGLLNLFTALALNAFIIMKSMCLFQLTWFFLLGGYNASNLISLVMFSKPEERKKFFVGFFFRENDRS